MTTQLTFTTLYTLRRHRKTWALLCVLLVFFSPHLEEYLCAKICNLCFSVPTWWVGLSACISLQSDNYGLANHYVDTCPSKNKRAMTQLHMDSLYMSQSNF